MRAKIILLLLLVTTYNCYAGSGITPKEAKTVAETYYRYTTGNLNAVGKIAQIDSEANGNILYYIVDMAKSGFVIVSGTAITHPIVAISTHGNYKAIPQSGVADYLYNLHNHISELYRLKIEQQKSIAAEWDQLSNGQPLMTSRSTTSVSPLLITTWNQSPYYNNYCPGGSVTGCVATAMAQIMKYWNYPATGTGSYSYSDSPYGTLSFNFDSTINWSIMPNSLTSSTSTNETDAVAILMYQLGVSVAMEYSPSGSGAYVLQSEDPGGPCAQYSYVNYFGYNSNTIQGLVQSNYSTTSWDSIVDVELNNSRPVEYVGFGADGGHTWVVDGYNTSGLYDMNWGWGGLDDGYFALNDLDPSGIPLGSDNAMLVGIEPGSAQPSCGEPTSLAASSITTSGAVISWVGSGSAKSYNLNYKVSGASSWTSVTGITSESYSLANLTAGTTYNVEVQQECTSGGSSSFTSAVSFSTTQPACNEPTSLAAGSVTTSSAVISWVGSGSPESYNLNYQKSGASSWTSITGITSENYTLSGLSAGTAYNIEVQQVCSGSETSSFTNTVSFSTTEATCSEPTSVAVNNITSSGATVTWVGSGSAESYTLNYQVGGESTWNSIGGITSESYSLSGLAAGTEYYVQVQQECTNGGSSGFTGIVVFTTSEATCAEPTSLAAGSITTSSAVISWVGSGSPESYNLNYQKSGASSWTSVTGITSESYALDGLAAGTAYNIEVQQVCSSSETSDFTGTVSFSTTEPPCDAPTSLAASDITTSGAVISWVGSGSPESYTLNYQVSGASSWTSVTGITSESYSLGGIASGTTYNVEVQQVCSSTETSNFTGTVSFSTASYCTSSGTATDEYIKTIKFGSIDNTSSDDDGGYQNYTNLSTDVTTGSSYRITVTPGFTTSTSYTEYWSIYIDYNHTGDFVLVKQGKGAGSLSSSIAIPTTALSGSTRMRIVMHRGSYISNACSSFTNGDVQDYTLVISNSSQSKIDLQPNDDDSLSVATNASGITVNVYPNPTNSILNIKYLDNIDVSDITLVDAMGKILLKSPSKLETLDFSSYAPGWYVLVITGSDGSISKNIITVAR